MSRLYEYQIKTDSVEQFDAVINLLEEMGRDVSFYRNRANEKLKYEFFNEYGTMWVLVDNSRGWVSWTCGDVPDLCDIIIEKADEWIHAKGGPNKFNNIVFEN